MQSRGLQMDMERIPSRISFDFRKSSEEHAWHGGMHPSRGQLSSSHRRTDGVTDRRLAAGAVGRIARLMQPRRRQEGLRN